MNDIKETFDSKKTLFLEAATQALSAQFCPQEAPAALVSRVESPAIKHLFFGDEHPFQVFVGVTAMNDRSCCIDFILPCDWRNRYEAIRMAVCRFQSLKHMSAIRTRIVEVPASAASYYCGFLAALGFHVETRATLSIMQELLRAQEKPLPPGYWFVDYSHDRLDRFSCCLSKAFAEMYTWLGIPSKNDPLQWIEEIGCGVDVEPSAIPAWVGLERDGLVVGFCQGGFDGHQPYIRNIAIVPEYGRRGLGRALLIECSKRLHRIGASQSKNPTVMLNVHRAWVPSLSFYRAIGFQMSRLFSDCTWYKADA